MQAAAAGHERDPNAVKERGGPSVGGGRLELKGSAASTRSVGLAPPPQRGGPSGSSRGVGGAGRQQEHRLMLDEEPVGKGDERGSRAAADVQQGESREAAARSARAEGSGRRGEGSGSRGAEEGRDRHGDRSRGREKDKERERRHSDRKRRSRSRSRDR